MNFERQFERQIRSAIRRQEIKNAFGLRNSKQDSIKITPLITFFEGTMAQPLKHITTGRGRLVNNALIDLSNVFSGGTQSSTYYQWAYGYAAGSGNPPAVPSIRLGTGTNSTTYSMTNLQTAIATAPNSIAGSVSNPSAGIYRTIFSATWNAGVLGTPTITEACLWGYGDGIQRVFGGSRITNGIIMLDRICSTDADFSSFTVNATKALTCAYQLEARFA